MQNAWLVNCATPSLVRLDIVSCTVITSFHVCCSAGFFSSYSSAFGAHDLIKSSRTKQITGYGPQTVNDIQPFVDVDCSTTVGRHYIVTDENR